MGGALNIAGPGENAEERRGADLGQMRLMWRVPDRNMGGQDRQRRAGAKAPAMRASQGGIKLWCRVVMVPIQDIGGDQEQAQVEILRCNRGIFADQAGVDVASRKFLADQGGIKSKIVSDAIKKYGIDPEKSNPVTV